MNCRRIEKLIPLYVEGDLEGDEAAAVLAHVETCGGCRELVAGYEASQRWLRSHTPPDFDDALLDGIKRGVLKEIGERRVRPATFAFFARPWAARPLFAAAAAVLIVFAALTFYFYSARSTAVSSRDELADAAPAPERDLKQDDVKTAPGAIRSDHSYKSKKRASGAAVKTSLAASNRNDRRTRPARPETVVAQANEHELPEATAPAEANAEEVPEMMRIEFQTSDPSIRIIWLTTKEADSQPLKPTTETD
jgi:hypothetical protein